MRIDKRIWKTGVLAAAITLVAGMFVMRLGEWQRGLDSEFVTHGQTATGGGGVVVTGGTGTNSVNVTKIIPQIVGGSFDGGLSSYTTYIQIINTGTTTANVYGSFYNQNGTASTLPISKDLNGALSSFSGTLEPTSLPVNGIVVLKVASAGVGAVNWGSITSTGTVTVGAAFEVRDTATNVLSARVGVAASPSDMKQFVIPRVHNTASGLDIGYAVVNTGSTVANISVTVRNASGSPVTKQLVLEPKHQIAIFTDQFFGSSLTNSVGTSFSGLTFSSDRSQIAAMALAIEGGHLASFPVDRLQ